MTQLKKNNTFQEEINLKQKTKKKQKKKPSWDISSSNWQSNHQKQ